MNQPCEVAPAGVGGDPRLTGASLPIYGGSGAVVSPVDASFPPPRKCGCAAARETDRPPPKAWQCGGSGGTLAVPQHTTAYHQREYRLSPL